MKIVQINTFPHKAPGTIMMDIHKELLKKGNQSYVVWGRGRDPENEYEIYMNDKIGVYFHGIYTRITDKTGFASKKATKKLLKKLDEIKPDIIHLHNIHGYYINIEMLFNYIKNHKIKVVWTFHDCWPFTGHCPYFTFIDCNKWQSKCHNCPQINKYPKSFKDNSKWNYDNKKRLFTGIDMTIVTPSRWLATLVKKSFLKNNNLKIINNGINTEIFKPRKSDFRKVYNIENKKIVLGVASEWTERKGLKDFIELSKLIDESVKIVLIGLKSNQIKKMPKNILCLERLGNPEKLAEIYSAADIFFNPTYEDNYPTVNLEASACGTTVITYDSGGSAETTNSIVINSYNEILPYINNSSNAKVKKIKNKVDVANNYIEVYEELLK